jgi:dihydroorotate dehydrogenase
MWERFGLSVMRRMDPERAHALAIAALKTGMLPLSGPVTSPRLATTLAGLALPNPVGLAAGFDKNAEAIAPLSRTGFGFLEVGGATPRPQAGNARPRLFRLTEDAAAINRFGFNNDGMEAIAARLAEAPRTIPVGLNLGANKDSPDRARDFAQVLTCCGPHVDFATVNVSSPNTERLRDLQGRAALEGLLAGVMEANAALATPVPIFLKIAPDLDDDGAGRDRRGRGDLRHRLHHRHEHHAVARRPRLAPPRRDRRAVGPAALRAQHAGPGAALPADRGAIPLLGVGGVSTVDQAWEKLRAGASAVQLYTALVYAGITLGARIAQGLDRRLEAEGMTMADVTGSGVDAWL